MPMTTPIVCRSAEELYSRAADAVAVTAERAVAARGVFSVALSGGTTPRSLYELLATDQYRSRIPWGNTHVFWGDERCVPPTHPDSNYRAAHDALLVHVPIPPANVHRLRGEEDAPEAAASEYERTLREFFLVEPGQAPPFDLLLLGMGDDGHTASLFPHTDALREERRTVVANFVDKLAAYRLTITPPVLRSAREVLVLVSGGAKARVLRDVLESPLDVDTYPSQLLRTSGGTVTWMVDAEAASLLSGTPG